MLNWMRYVCGKHPAPKSINNEDFHYHRKKLNAIKQRCIKTFPPSKKKFQPTCITFHPTGKHLAVSGISIIEIWNLQTGKCIRTLTPPEVTCSTISFSHNEEYIFVKENCNDNKIYENSGIIFHAEDGDWENGRIREIKDLSTLNFKSFTSSWSYPIDYRTDKELNTTSCLMSGELGANLIWDMSDNRPQLINFAARKNWMREYSYCGKYVAYYDSKGLYLYAAKPQGNIYVKEKVKTFDNFCHAKGCGFAFSPNSRHLAFYSSRDKTIKVLDLEKYEFIRTFFGHTKAVDALTFTPDGNYIVSAGKSGLIAIWGIKQNKCIQSFKANNLYINMLIASPNRKFLVYGRKYDNESIKLWDISFVLREDQLDQDDQEERISFLRNDTEKTGIKQLSINLLGYNQNKIAGATLFFVMN